MSDADTTEDTSEATLRQEGIDYLRDILDVLEKNPEIPNPFTASSIKLWDFNVGEDQDAKTLMRLARREIGGHWDKSYDDHAGGDMWLTQTVGDVTVKIIVDRDAVCTARVVGKETVIEQRYPPGVQYVEVEVEKDIIEWDCE